MMGTFWIWLMTLSVRQLYGAPCPDYEAGCPACDAWLVVDQMREANGMKVFGPYMSAYKPNAKDGIYDDE